MSPESSVGSRSVDGLLALYRQTEEYPPVSTDLEAGRLHRVGGVRPGAFAFFLSAFSLDHPEKALLVLTSGPEESEDLVDALKAFGCPRAHLFPAWDSLFGRRETPDPEIYRDRMRPLVDLARGRSPVVCVPAAAVVQPVPGIGAVGDGVLTIRRGQDLGPQELSSRLVLSGYRRCPLVERRGEFAHRGGILDLFPHDREHPIRVEFFGDTVDGIRAFDVASQTSVQEMDEVELVLLGLEDFYRERFRPGDSTLLDYLPRDAPVLVREGAEVRERIGRIFASFDAPGDGEAFLTRLEERSPVWVDSLPVPEAGGSRNLRFGPVDSVRGDIPRVVDAVRARLAGGSRVVIFCETEGEGRRLGEILADHGIPSDLDADGSPDAGPRDGGPRSAAIPVLGPGGSFQRHRAPADAGPPEGGEGGVGIAVGALRQGFEIGPGLAIVFTSREIFNRRVIRRARARGTPSRPIDDFLELRPGDHVVHLAHGIGRFIGMERIEKGGRHQEFLVLGYREGARLYVPVSKIDLVQRYIGSGSRMPVLDHISGAAWRRKKEAVARAIEDLAAELLEIQAMRQERPGIAYPSDDDWQREFEASFPFDDTADQVAATDAIKSDMESPRPMDRLVCGDVGYGKTELAMRATFKAVSAGKQVAVLVPTTVLAEQHHRTFRERMAGFPVRIEMLSRFRTRSEQKEILARTAAGGVDVLIGTHRLLSDDVAFRDLGLLIIDEEQRFGVAHKEKLKRLRKLVDVLTLTATPIPRTLHMALLGIRDISSLGIAPEGRVAVRTEVCRFDRRKIREAVLRELCRDGQVYYVHNRIFDIERVKDRLVQIVPEARVECAHGQMPEHLLEERMRRFVHREFDVLVSTTIIESGLDIPNVNTIVIDDADTYGLADLHQLRGRVGRYKYQAYAYLLLPDHRHLNPEAQKRLRAIEELSELGSGFQIALRDLEIRGAGNILGPEQSGHIATIGYDLYCRLLGGTVRRMRNEPCWEPMEVEIALDLAAFIPEAYVPGAAGKLDLYRRVATTQDEADLDAMREEIRDRFGPVPPPVETLTELHRLRIRLARLGIPYLGVDGGRLVFRLDGTRPLGSRHPLKQVDRRMTAVMAPYRIQSPEVALKRALEWTAALSPGEPPGGGPGASGLDPRPGGHTML